MWWPDETDILICHEKSKDMRRAAARERLAAEASLQRQGEPRLGQKILIWLGGQMIHVGLKLQHIEAGVFMEAYARRTYPPYDLPSRAKTISRR